MKLYIYEHGGKYKEILELDSNIVTRIELPYMSLTTAFNKALEKQLDDVPLRIDAFFTDMFELIKVMGMKYKESNELKMTDYLEAQLLCGNKLPCDAALLGNNNSIGLAIGYWENIAVSLAFEEWLLPPDKDRRKRKATPFEKYGTFFSSKPSPLDYTDDYFTGLSKRALFPKETTDLDNYNTYSSINISNHFNTVTYEISINRYNQSHPLPFPETFMQIKGKNQMTKYVISKKVKPKLHTSYEGIMPLIWAEVFFSLENDLYINKCEICSNYFPIQFSKHNQVYCSIKCRNESKRRKSSEERERKRGAQNGKKTR